MNNDIAVVIVNWNKKYEVIKLLNELESIPEKVDIYVVDNASTDDSVYSIRQSFPTVNVLVNRQNLGGTGGFNTGLHHVSKCNKYSYVWLLDNDAKIQNDTLSELLRAMDDDSSIGLAGSRIIDKDKTEITVETGGKLRWDIIGIEALNRNSIGNFPKIIDVDYVAICSALVRVETLKMVGLMDERIFIFWDDMDWGLSFKESGHRVVCVTESISFHGSFTERDRGMTTGYYYGIRNAFLVYTKHTKIIKRCLIFYRSLRYHFRNYIFYVFQKKHMETKLMRKAFYDYLTNHWGKLSINDSYLKLDKKRLVKKGTYNQAGNPKNILVSVLGTNPEDIPSLFNLITKHYSKSKITVLVHHDRAEYFNEYDTILVDRKKTHQLKYLLSMFLNIKWNDFDAAIAISPSPFLYSVSQVILINKNGEILSEFKSGIKHLFTICLAIEIGEIAAHLLFPIMISKSLRYQNILAK